ncbi:indole-3-glycerol phosphate synthase TrpC [Paenibacillus radicis (ex Gao et al. 2016)]|uniref:Indole-3-glycerol phosphate synthase n=1 Tax=Paenibacillus radicis (ex Gao et al. 2016) TaxID=1737354 RepID=A0A917GUX7_9BACL|nr:indole-3-glycerol phosphate synthase TrpC [Paenibacillus radicis (ex Gao et al. 2016)]GGG57733.1 indole-3-glycerol-phosphate synthase [Paenibacillus radicis (ex Gao et al. 2016)]
MFLDKIVATKRNEVAALARQFQLAEYEKRISELKACRGFEKALNAGRKRDMGLIAEVKKASPSKGLIRADFHPAELATAYEKAGADCISVLTDRDYFQGSNEYLTLVHETVAVPLLRKDFIIDYKQVYEARVIGADAVLLIAAILTKQELSELYDIAKSLGLDVLVEVHDRQELEQVLELDKASLIGVNNRDLKSFVTDLTTTEQLIALMPENVTVISESGIAGRKDMDYLQSIGAQGVLIGEHFMRQSDAGAAIIDLMGPVNA